MSEVDESAPTKQGDNVVGATMNHVANPIRVCAPFWHARGLMFIVTLLSLSVCRNFRRSGIVFGCSCSLCVPSAGNRQTTSPVRAVGFRRKFEERSA